MSKNHSFLLLLLCCFITFSPFFSYAAVTVAETSQLSFGMLEIPVSGVADITIDQDSGVATGSGSQLRGNSSPGQYLLSSTENSGVVTIDIQNISTGSSALTLSQFKGRYGSQAINSFPASNLAVPNTGTILNVGAKLTYSAAVLEQAYNMHFDIVVNYE